MYDAASRLLKKAAPDDVAEYNYDVIDNLVSVLDSDSSLTMTYDLAKDFI